MVVVKWSEKVEGFGDLYKKYDNSLVPWSVPDPDANTNCFTWSKEENDWIVPEDQYDEQLKNWRGPIHNCQFRSQTLKQKRKTEYTCSKYKDSTKFNGILREGKPAIPINSYKDPCREHMICDGMRYVFSLPEPHNIENK